MRKLLLLLSILAVSCASIVNAQPLNDKSIKTIERAMTDELNRSKEKLHLNGLIDPFFISYTVNDQQGLNINASFGSLTRSNTTNNRTLNLRLLINNYQFNDENFSDASSMFGGGSSVDMNLPLDDDYDVIRRSFWLATDNLFKDANETFTKKKAALERKQLSEEDRNLPDFSQATKVEVLEPPVPFSPNKSQLEALVRSLSGVFVKYKLIQNCSVALTYNNTYRFFISNEGTHTRSPLRECNLTVQASAQAQEDGEPLSLAFTISELTPDLFPTQEVLMKRTEELAQNLTTLSTAPKYNDKEYSGPVLFEGQACNDFLSEQLIGRFASKREDVLGGGDVFFMAGGGKGISFQKKLGTRILPASVNVTDNSNLAGEKNSSYLGRYSVDEEGVVPSPNLQLVQDGILKTLYMTRTPTKEIRESNGHARPGSGGMAPGAGILEISDTKAKKYNDLKKELFKIAKEDGYDFAIVVRSLQSGLLSFSDGMSSLGDLMNGGKALQPSLVYKIFPNGKEVLIRGLEINFPTTRDLKELQFSKERSTRNIQLAAGAGIGLFGFSSKVGATLIAPDALLVPELEARMKQSAAYPIKPIVDKP